MLRDGLSGSLTAILPDKVRNLLNKNALYDLTRLTEIRLRDGKPIIMYLAGRAVFFNENGRITAAFAPGCIKADKHDIEQTVSRGTGYSMYSHFDDAASGFITAPGGHRIGVCATGIKDGKGFRDIESLNIRAAGEHTGCADELCGSLFADGLCSFLIAGQPGSGKTTALRDCARYLSENPAFCYPRIVIADERREISLCAKPDSLMCCDVIKGLSKVQAFSHALRTMCPDIILTDEIAYEDTLAVQKAADCGVFIGATVHAGTFEEAERKYGLNRLIKGGVFKKIAVLGDKSNPGTVAEIITL